MEDVLKQLLSFSFKKYNLRTFSKKGSYAKTLMLYLIKIELQAF